MRLILVLRYYRYLVPIREEYSEIVINIIVIGFNNKIIVINNGNNNN